MMMLLFALISPITLSTVIKFALNFLINRIRKEKRKTLKIYFFYLQYIKFLKRKGNIEDDKKLTFLMMNENLFIDH